MIKMNTKKNTLSVYLKKGKFEDWRERLLEPIIIIFHCGCTKYPAEMNIYGKKKNVTSARNAYRILCTGIISFTRTRYKNKQKDFQDEFKCGLVAYIHEKILVDIKKDVKGKPIEWEADYLLNQHREYIEKINLKDQNEHNAGYKAGEGFIRHLIKPVRKTNNINLYKQIKKMANMPRSNSEIIQDTIIDYATNIKEERKVLIYGIQSLNNHAKAITTGNFSHHKQTLIKTSESIIIHLEKLNKTQKIYNEMRLLNNLQELLTELAEQERTATTRSVKKLYKEMLLRLQQIILKSV